MHLADFFAFNGFSYGLITIYQVNKQVSLNSTLKFMNFIENLSENAHLKTKSHSIIVRWNDAPIGHFLANYDKKLSFEYTIDISPGPATELGLKSVLYKKDEDVLNGKPGNQQLSGHFFSCKKTSFQS